VQPKRDGAPGQEIDSATLELSRARPGQQELQSPLVLLNESMGFIEEGRDLLDLVDENHEMLGRLQLGSDLESKNRRVFQQAFKGIELEKIVADRVTAIVQIGLGELRLTDPPRSQEQSRMTFP
jgi:hypothetical protein